MDTKSCPSFQITSSSGELRADIQQDLQFPDFDVSPSDFEGAGAFFDAVYLEADKAFGVGFEFFFVGQVGDLSAVDPGLDAWSFGEDTTGVPLAFFEVFVGLEFVFGGHPSTCGFSVDVPGFAAAFNFNLGAVYATCGATSGLGADLDSGVQTVVDFDSENEFEIAIKFVGAEE